MDITSIILGVAILTLFIVPFVIAHIKKSNEKKTFQNFCDENSLSVSETETVGKYTIAIDRANRKFVRTEINGSSISSLIIDIEPGCRCEVVGDETQGISLSIGGKPVRFTSADDGIQTSKEAMYTAGIWKRKICSLK